MLCAKSKAILLDQSVVFNNVLPKAKSYVRNFADETNFVILVYHVACFFVWLLFVCCFCLLLCFVVVLILCCFCLWHMAMMTSVSLLIKFFFSLSISFYPICCCCCCRPILLFRDFVIFAVVVVVVHFVFSCLFRWHFVLLYLFFSFVFVFLWYA